MNTEHLLTKADRDSDPLQKGEPRISGDSGSGSGHRDHTGHRVRRPIGLVDISRRFFVDISRRFFVDISRRFFVDISGRFFVDGYVRVDG